MIHTCKVSLETARFSFYVANYHGRPLMGVKILTPIMADRVSRQGKKKTTQFRGIFV